MLDRAARRSLAGIIAALLLLAPGFVRAQVDVQNVDGVAEVYFPQTRQWQRIPETPFRLENGDRVRTGEQSSADLDFPDGSHVRLGPSSAFTMQSGSRVDVVLGLDLGSLKAWVSHLVDRHEFHVRTPTAVCAVRGTRFVVDVSPDKATLVDVSQGVVAVKTLLGEELELGDGRPMRSIRVLPDRPLDLPAGVRASPAGKQTKAGPAAAGDRVAAVSAPLPPPPATAEIVGEGDKEEFKKDVQREVALGLSEEAVQAAAAEEARRAEYMEGKTMIDAFGRRVRLEEYVVRPAADSFKLVALNSRDGRFDYFYYQAQFNKTLPTDLTLATRYLGGKDGTAPDYYVTAYETGRSNTQDSIQEFATGGHLVSTTLTADKTFYDATLNAYRTVKSGSSFWSTLFDNYSYRIDGTEKFGWQPASGSGITSYDYVAGGINTRIWNGAGMAETVCTTTSCESAARASATSTPDGSGVLHDRATITYAADGSQETYDFFVVGDDGRLATTADFGGVTSGQTYLDTLLKYNFEQTISATEFHGRTIDFVVEPKILAKAGLLP